MPWQTPKDLNLYHVVGKKKMKFIDAKYQTKVKYWTQKNCLQDSTRKMTFYNKPMQLLFSHLSHV